MNKFANLISTLTAMRIQGYSSQQLFDVWNSLKKDILVSLNDDLLIAILGGDRLSIKHIIATRTRLKKIGNEIHKGILE